MSFSDDARHLARGCLQIADNCGASGRVWGVSHTLTTASLFRRSDVYAVSRNIEMPAQAKMTPMMPNARDANDEVVLNGSPKSEPQVWRPLRSHFMK